MKAWPWLAGMGAAGLFGSLVLMQLGGATAKASDVEQPDWAGAEAAVPENPLKDAYFGELHLHTNHSFDSFIFGNPLGPDEAYRFAQGEPVKFYGGQTRQLDRPLDFAAVTDHAEFLGELRLCTTPGSEVYETEMCASMRANNMASFSRLATSVTARKRMVDVCHENGELCVATADSLWTQVRLTANRHYKPGKFTTLIGYEFSANAPTAKFTNMDNKTKADVPGMLHRNVIFRSDVVPDRAFSAYDGTGEDMHKWMEANCTGACRVLAIPHNINYSWGRFFWDGRNSDGTPWTKEVLERRARVEPLIEIFQIKGSSECMAGVGLTDEECGFENAVAACQPGEEDGCASGNAFVRTGLVKGLKVEAEMGVNPFKYGIIAATDSHNGNPGDTREDAYPGHLGGQDATMGKRLGYLDAPGTDGKHQKAKKFGFTMYNPGGLAGVWAPKNTRGEIWDALQRRETFGTSGTRIKVRFFGSFAYPSDLHRRRDMLATAYAQGVPMGGDLKGAGKAKSPRFVVQATRDPQSAPLQKIQIIKGWVENGALKSRTFDVVCSDGIKPDRKTDMCADNGAKVDLETCAPAPGKGAAQLSATWNDPAFDAGKRAVYYVRVLENPTCRWSQRDSLKLGVPHDSKWSAAIKERAWTSPIWYSPN
jgi:hypothetical protein